MIGSSSVPRCSPPYSELSSCAHVRLRSPHLAGGTTARDVCASSGLLTTSDGVTAPSPAGARALAAEDVNVGGRAGNGSSVLCHGETRDGHTGGRHASG